MQLGLFITLYLIALPLFVLCDFLWLSFLAKDFYRTHMGNLMGEVVWPAVLIFYALFPIGLTLFAIYPGSTQNSVLTAALFGGLFGFFAYATYDLTNLATVRSWSPLLSLVDIVWGSFLCACVAGAAVFIRGLLMST